MSKADWGLFKAQDRWPAFVDEKLTVAQPAPPPLAASDVFWHEAAQPVSSAKLLGTFKIGEPVYFRVPITATADVALRTVGRNALGVRTALDVKYVQPDLIVAQGLGGGSGSVGPGTAGTLAMFNSSAFGTPSVSTIKDSCATYDGTTFKVASAAFTYHETNAAADLADFRMEGNTGAAGFVRFEHRTNALGGCLDWSGANDPLPPGSLTRGEVQFVFNVDGTFVQSIGFGPKAITSLQNSFSILRPDAYAGPVLSVYNQAGTVQQFTVNQVGEIRVLAGIGYHWPLAGSGEPAVNQVLTCQSITGIAPNAAYNLAWMPASSGSAGIGPGTGGTLSMFGGTFGAANQTTIVNSDISDDGSTIKAVCVQFIAQQKTSGGDTFDYYWRTAANATQTTASAVWRFDHRTQVGGGTIDAANTQGEMQLFLNIAGGSPDVNLGNVHSWFQQGVIIRPRSTYSGWAFRISPSTDDGSNPFFSVDAADGNLSRVRGVGYTWPVAPLPGGTTYLSTTAAGVLSWSSLAIPAAGVTMGSPAAAQQLTRWSSVTAPGTINDSGIADDSTNIFIKNRTTVQQWIPASVAASVFQICDSTGANQLFAINQVGELRIVNSLGYHWPGTGAQGSAGQVLTIQSVAQGVASLIWATPSTAGVLQGAPSNANQLTRWSSVTAPGMIKDSRISDDDAWVRITSDNTGFYQSSNDLYDLTVSTFIAGTPPTHAVGVWRFEHRAANVDVSNTTGEFQGFPASGGACFRFGAGLSTLTGSLHVGNLTQVNTVTYSWPSGAQPALNSVLTCTNQAAGTLEWIVPVTAAAGVTMGSPANAHQLTRWTSVTAPGSIIDSAISDDNSWVRITQNTGVSINNAAADLAQLDFVTSTASDGAMRFEHRSPGTIIDSLNTQGEFWFYGAGTTTMARLGVGVSIFPGAVRCANLTQINSVTYSWPGTAPLTGQVLACSNTTGGVLQWQAGATVAAGAAVNYLTKYNTTAGQLINSSAYDTGSVFQIQNSLFQFLRPSAYTGVSFEIDITGAPPTPQFQIDYQGNIVLLNRVAYSWPTAGPTAVGQVLACQTVAGGVLSWQNQSGAGGGANTALSNLAATAINVSLNPGVTDSVNIGTPTLRIGAIYLRSGVFVYPIGSTPWQNSAGSPTAFGNFPSASPTTSEATQFNLYGFYNALQSGKDTRTQMTAYYGIELRGSRATTASGADYVNGATTDPCVSILPERSVVALQIRPRTSTQTPNNEFNSTANLFEAWNNGALRTSLDPFGTLMTVGGTRLGVRELQGASGSTNQIATNDRTLCVDSINGSFTIQLPAVSAVRGMIIDIIAIRQVQSIFNSGASGSNGAENNTITLIPASGDVFNAWGAAAQATSFALNNTSGHRMIKVVADSNYNVWWTVPYYV